MIQIAYSLFKMLGTNVFQLFIPPDFGTVAHTKWTVLGMEPNSNHEIHSYLMYDLDI